MSRRFITRTDIDAALDEGQDVLHIGEKDTVTDLAREHAQNRGLKIQRGEAPPHQPSDEKPTLQKSDPAAFRQQVRDAVVAELGPDTKGLDEAIDRILKG